MTTHSMLHKEKTLRFNNDKWRSLIKMLNVKTFVTRAFTMRPALPVLSAGKLSRLLYDPHMGGNRALLDMSKIVLNDREKMSKDEVCGERKDGRVARISVFDDRRAFVIDTVMLLSVWLCMAISPLAFAFGGSWSDPSPIPGGRALLICDVLLDLFYMLYLLLLLDMSFLHPRQRIEVVTWWKIVKRCKNSPMYWLKWISTTVHFWAMTCGAPLAFNVIKFVRGVVFIELPDSLWQFHDMPSVRITKPVLLLMVSAHWVACLLFCIGGYLEKMQREGEEVFETVFRSTTVNGKLSAYVVAYVEAIYMLTGALDGPTGDGAREGNFGALIMVVVFAPIGQLVVAMFIAAIVQEANLAKALDMKHSENKAYMQRALQILGVPKDLQRRVFSMHYFQKMSHDFEALELLFDKKHLSNALASSLQVYLYKDSVLNAPYFHDKDPTYIIEVVHILKDIVSLPGDYVARRGEIASSMYFVAHGCLAVLIHNVNHPQELSLAKEVGTLERGRFFGQVALLSDCVRTASVRANSYVLLSSLSRYDIEPIWKYFPQEREYFVGEVHSVVARDKQRRARDRWKNAMNNPKLLKLPASEPPEPAEPAEPAEPVAPLRSSKKEAHPRSSRQVALARASGQWVPDGDAGKGKEALESTDSVALPDDKIGGSGSTAQVMALMLARQATLETMVAAIVESLGASGRGEQPQGPPAKAEPAAQSTPAAPATSALPRSERKWGKDKKPRKANQPEENSSKPREKARTQRASPSKSYIPNDDANG